jgi:hypothetical protein
MQQLSINFEPGILGRYASGTEACASVVYRTGLARIAAKADLAPSKLSEKLSGARGLTVDDLEKIVQATGDATPILWLAARYCQDADAVQRQAMAQLPGVIAQLQTLMATAGGGK